MLIKYLKLNILIIFLSLVCTIYASESNHPKPENVNGSIFYRLKKGEGITFSSINTTQLIKKDKKDKLYTDHDKPDVEHSGGMTMSKRPSNPIFL